MPSGIHRARGHRSRRVVGVLLGTKPQAVLPLSRLLQDRQSPDYCSEDIVALREGTRAIFGRERTQRQAGMRPVTL